MLLTTIIVFIFILSLLIFVHEFGHFIVAKKVGIKVEEFGFGYPPRIGGIYRDNNKKWKIVGSKVDVEKLPNTLYSFNWIPFGGFVKMLGQDDFSAEVKKEDKKKPKSFLSQPVWKRCIVILAGVVMNVLLTVTLFSIGFGIGLPSILDNETIKGSISIKNEKIQISYIVPNSPAKKAGIEIGDEIISIDGIKFYSVEAVQDYIRRNSGKEITLNIDRAGDRFNIGLIPRKNPPPNQGPMGVGLVKTGIVSFPWYKSIWKGISGTFIIVYQIIIAFYEMIKILITTGTVAETLSGPVGIAFLTSRVTQMGFIYVLQFTAFLSINLAIINILPFPSLDGGRLLFLIIEKIRGKKTNIKVENWIHIIGFALLILLMVFVTFRDITRYKDKIWVIIERVFNL